MTGRPPDPTSVAPAASHSVWPWVETDPGVTGDPALLPPDGRWPRITIVTPNYNYGSLLERTIRSVVQQAYPNLEYVVVDDGSTDNSVEVIRRYESRLTRWIHRDNRGQYVSVNEGFAETTGEIMAWLDSDDVHMPWTLRCVASIFSRHPEVQWVVGHPAVLHDAVIHHLQPRRPFPREMIRAGLFHGGPGGLGWIPQEHMFWRRSLWEKAGTLRGHLPVGADYDMNVRFAEHADLHVCSTVLGGFMARPGQNRSTTERPQYLRDIATVQEEIAAHGIRPPPGLATYLRLQRVPIARSLARRALGISRLVGPVLQWDFASSSYKVVYESFFR